MHGSPWPLHPALLPIGQLLVPGKPVEVSDGVYLFLGIAFTVLFLASTDYFWNHDEKGAAVATAVLSVVTVVEVLSRLGDMRL